MPRPVSRANGNCPYCDAVAFGPSTPRRPNQVMQRCTGCDGYSVLDTRTGVRYPLADRTDPKTPPQV